MPGRAADQVDDPVTVGARFLEFLDRLDGRGVVLAVDDAHWADRPSLQALIFALRRLVADRVLAIIAVRDDRAPDLPDSLGRLIRKQTGTVLRLRGLDEEDLLELAAAMGIDGVSAGAARRLRYGTQGNPLHARALLEEFPPSEWGSDEELLPSPRSFRRLVQDRYQSCAEPTRRLIDAVAVLGSHCPLPVAAALAAVTDAFPAIEEASGRRSPAGLRRNLAMDAVVPAPAGAGRGVRRPRPGEAPRPAHPGRGADDGRGRRAASSGRGSGRTGRGTRRRSHPIRRRAGPAAGLAERRRARRRGQPAQSGSGQRAAPGSSRGDLGDAAGRRGQCRPVRRRCRRLRPERHCATWCSARSRWRRTTRPPRSSC